MKMRTAIVLLTMAVFMAIYALSYSVPFAPVLTPTDELAFNRPDNLFVKSGDSAEINLVGTKVKSDDLRFSLSPSMPSERNAHLSSFPLEGTFDAIYRHGDILYLGGYKIGLKAVSVADPKRPRLLAEYLSDISVIDVQYYDGHLYFACADEGIVVAELKRDGHISIKHRYSLANTVRKLKFVGQRLFVSTNTSLVLAFEARSEGQLQRVEEFDLALDARLMTVLDGQLIVVTRQQDVILCRCVSGRLRTRQLLHLDSSIKDIAAAEGTIYLVDGKSLMAYQQASNGHFKLSAQLHSFGSPDRVLYREGKLYVVDDFIKLNVVAPDDLSVLRSVTLKTDVRVLSLHDQYLYLAGSHRGLLIIDNTKLKGGNNNYSLDTEGSSRDLIVAGERLYVADQSGGILYRDAKNVTAPLTRFSQSPARSFCYDPRRKYLYVALGNDGIEVFDVSGEGPPVSIALWPDMSAMYMALSRNLLVVSRGTKGLALVDISDPAAMRIIDQKSQVRVVQMQCKGNVLFAAANRDGLQIYRIHAGGFEFLSEVRLPFPMNHFSNAIDVTVSGARVVVANGRSGVMVVDASDIRNPIISSQIQIDSFAKLVHIDKGYLYVGGQSSGLNQFDLSEPESPYLLNHIPIRGVSQGMDIASMTIYLAHGNSGILAVPKPVLLDCRRCRNLSADHLHLNFSAPVSAGVYDLQISDGSDVVRFERLVHVR